MSEAEPVGSPRRRPEASVGVGQVVCDLASSASSEGAPAARYLEVVIPVSVRLAHPKRGSDLVVRAELRAPFDRRAAPAFVPSPSAEYDDASTTIRAGIDFAPVSGSVEVTASRQRLACDVTGVGTCCLEWSISGEDRQLAGNYEFRFLVRQQDAVFGWLEVTAELHAARGFPGLSPKPVSGYSCSPVVADSSPQAAMTLVLRDESDPRAPWVFVGRPLDLPLSKSPGGLAVGHAAPGAEVIGSIRWFDSVEGRPGYQWVQKSSALASLSGTPGEEIQPGERAFLEDDSILHLPTGRRLRVAYDGVYTSGPATVKDALDIQVVIDDVTVAGYTTESSYLTVGRIRKDISINRPDVSREHGSLELFDDGWSYAHQSGTHDAALLRDGAKQVLIPCGSSVRVGRGDTIRFNDHVSLVIK
jgi:hypothetical protein